MKKKITWFTTKATDKNTPNFMFPLREIKGNCFDIKLQKTQYGPSFFIIFEAILVCDSECIASGIHTRHHRLDWVCDQVNVASIDLSGQSFQLKRLINSILD